jgi:hypothetical protein
LAINLAQHEKISAGRTGSGGINAGEKDDKAAPARKCHAAATDAVIPSRARRPERRRQGGTSQPVDDQTI